MDTLEIEINRENTRAFIAARPVTLILTPKAAEKERTPSGGWRQPDVADRDPQVFRIIERSAQSVPPQIKVQDGTLREIAFWLLADTDVAVADYDHWTDPITDRIWTVAEIIRSNEYEIRCVVVEYGE